LMYSSAALLRGLPVLVGVPTRGETTAATGPLPSSNMSFFIAFADI
jgi:hypothetical protein